MIDTLTIQIPYELARYIVGQRSLVTRYETNALIKALDTWLVLKAETKSSFIQGWNQQKQYLLSLCKVSESIFRARLKILQDLQLVQYNRNDIRVCSWDRLATQFEIDIQAKFTVQYSIHDKKRIQDWLIATEIKDRQNRQAYKILQKVNKNPEIEMAFIAAIIKAGGDRNRLSDPVYFINWLMILYRNDFIMGSDIHDLLVEIRPDTNRGVRTMANHWKCKSPTTISYWKRILQRSGIVDISKLQIESNDRMRNPLCKVLWLKEVKQTLLCFCDSITVLQPWLRVQSLQTIFKDNTSNENFLIRI